MALALGRPGESGLQATLGIISARQEAQDGDRPEYILHTDAVLYPGFSGGPLVNMHGQIVGLLNLSFGRGMGVALGLPILTHVADALLAGGSVQRGYLGVSTQAVPLPQSLKISLGLTQDHALLVVQVESGGPADTGGLLLGDMLLGIGGGGFGCRRSAPSPARPGGGSGRHAADCTRRRGARAIRDAGGAGVEPQLGRRAGARKKGGGKPRPYGTICRGRACPYPPFRSSTMTTAILGALTAQTAELIDTLRRSVVVVRGSDGHGAGVIWDSQGLIVTNDHVARGDRADVELSDGRRLQARTLARDRENDLALLRVSARDLPAAPVGDSQALKVGELILAVGHPWGLRETATLGIVSGAGPGTWLGQTRQEMLQADIALSPGNSGGPLADAWGRVVGIASMVLSSGIALAVPSHVVQRFVQSALAHSYRRAV